jgi:hypothetical protein
MRKLLPGDIDLATRALAAAPPAQRATLLARLVTEAHAADKYTRRFRRRHPLWGDGALGSAARARPLAPACGPALRARVVAALAARTPREPPAFSS